MKLQFMVIACILWLLALEFCAAANLVGYWALDENQGTVAGNSAVSGYGGVLNGCTWLPSKVGSGLDFNGTSDYVVVSNTTSPNP